MLYSRSHVAMVSCQQQWYHGHVAHKLHFVAGQSIIEFVEQPLSLLIPVNEIGVFSCRVRCLPNPCLGFWIINNLHSQDMHHRSQLELRGFAFTDTQRVMDEYKLSLTVNASEAANSSMIACEYSMTGVIRLPSISMAAELLVISSKFLNAAKVDYSLMAIAKT